MELTKAEEQIMQILWTLKRGFVKDILDEIDEPKPAYSTVSTIIRTLEKKGFVHYKAYGNSHQYYPLINKDEYKKEYLNGMVKNYFNGSFKQLVSFFSKENTIDLKDVDEVIKTMEELKQKTGGNHE